ncbi:MAG: hypothetical protein QM813_06210, partial [Verrucomicrobiota bacterium]
MQKKVGGLRRQILQQVCVLLAVLFAPLAVRAQTNTFDPVDFFKRHIFPLRAEVLFEFYRVSLLTLAILCLTKH